MCILSSIKSEEMADGTIHVVVAARRADSGLAADLRLRRLALISGGGFAAASPPFACRSFSQSHPTKKAATAAAFSVFFRGCL
jgi:hypothetical protein